MHANPHASTASAATAAAVLPAAAVAADYLVYRTAGRQYGAALRNVHELRRFDEVCAPPAGAPRDAVIGTISVQGAAVPVIDLAAMLGLAPADHASDMEVVVLACGAHLIAIAAECVIDVVTLAPEQMRLAPAIRAEDGAHYLLGFGRLGQRVLGLLDIRKLAADLHPARLAA
ncbi:MAG TPA: chemotaxis protein CheW [Noviherbaspirillum sp.]|nr:chemotaxis protein CheW [Noviherbaspirillum sp.]